MNEGRPAPSVSYRISLQDPETHCASVTMTLRGVRSALRDGKVAVRMPVWTPGSYLIREFPRNILSLDAKDRGGRKLHVSKDAKDTWLVAAGEDDELVVSYLVYAFSFGVNTSYIDSDHAILNGASVFTYAEGLQNAPISLEVVPYTGWSQISTGMEREAGKLWTFVAPNYDILVDSPIEVGNQHVHTFDVGGVPYEVSIFAPKPLDETAFVSDLKKIVEASITVYQEVPYSRYVFLVDFSADGNAGLEHLNSTHCMAGYYWLEPPEEYRDFLTLFSHEFFHAWNVKRMRPRALGPFDYRAENYTRSLWVAEGLTSYYEEVILRRSGILPVNELLEHLSAAVSQVKSLPGARVMSPEESSFDAWIRYYRQDENTPNVTPSYYRQGTVLGLLLDLRVRDASDGSASLDDAMRKVYRETYLRGTGYSDDDFERACDSVSRGQTAELFARYVQGKEEIDYDRYLGLAGLALVPRSVPSKDEGFLGIRVRSSPNFSVATRLTGSPAEAADLSPGDEILATDGIRTDGQRLPYYIANKKPGTNVELLVSRNGTVKTLRVALGQKPALDYRIQKKKEASQREKAVFSGWALAEWDAPLVFTEHRVSPARGRVLDYF